MPKVLKLIQNENMKLYSRWGTWIMVFLLIAAVTGMVLLLKFQPKPQFPEGAPDKAQWKQMLQQENEQMKQMLADPQMPQAQKDMMQENLKMNEYRIQHNISPLATEGVVDVLTLSKNFMIMITIFTIIVAGGTVAGEFSTGTIKLLLIRPVNRAKVLFSKYITSLLFALLLVLILFLTSLLMGSLFFGLTGLDIPQLYYSGGQVLERSVVEQTFINFGFGAVELIIWVTLAFMISTVFRNSALAIGFSIFILFISMPIMGFLMKYSWAKYLLFFNTNLAVYFNGTPPIKGMTLSFSIWTLIIYFAIFHILSFFVFKKRDVAA